MSLSRPVRRMRARASRGVGLLLSARPSLIRTDRAASIATHSLTRRLGAGPGARRGALADLAKLGTSDNPRAVLVALRAWRGAVPDEVLARLRSDLGRPARHGGVLLELARAEIRRDEPGAAAATLARALAPGVVHLDVTAVIEEALPLRDARLLAHLGEAGDRPGLAPEDRAALSTLGWVGTRLLAGDTPGTVVRSRPDDALAVTAAVPHLEGLGLGDLRDLGTALLGAPAADATARARAAKALRAAGDIRTARDLAATALPDLPEDNHLRSIVEDGASNLRQLEQGWSPPPRAERAYTPQPGAVDYLLHSSLPHVSQGYSTRTHGLLTALNADGWDVRGITRPSFPYGQPVFAKGDVPAQDEVDNVTYARLLDGRRTFPFWPLEQYVEEYVRLLTPLVTERRTGILHAASNFRNGVAATTLARRLGLPSVYEVRGLWEYTRQAREPEFSDSELFALTARLEADACRGADRVVVITAALKDVLVERDVPADSIVVVPNGVNTERFRPVERDAALAAELGLAGKTVIGYVGSILEYEGLALLVEAARRLAAERDDFAVLVVGDGRTLDDLRTQVAEADLSGTVVFTGRVPHEEVERYYSLVDIAPFPRLGVTVCELVSPLKPFEAMAMGKVVVVSSVAAMAEIVEDGRTGMVFTKGSATDLADVLRRLLDDPGLRGRIAEEGRRTVVRDRSWAALSRRVADLYAELWDVHGLGRGSA